jgi:hypothetical protein
MKSLLLLLLLSTTEHTVRLAPGATPEPARIEDMAWLAGRWTGDGLGGTTEEVWSPPMGGVMVGTFRLLREDKVVFYEFLTLSVTDRGLAMRLKHFNPDMSGWEEKEKFVEFRYVGTKGDLVQFEGLTFRRDSKDALTIFLALKGKDGTVREERFRMKRE